MTSQLFYDFLVGFQCKNVFFIISAFVFANYFPEKTYILEQQGQWLAR